MAGTTLGVTRMLQREEVLDVVIERLNGKFIGRDLIPIRPVDSDTFKWYYKGTIGGMTPRVGENDYGSLIDTEYQDNVGRTEFFRQRTQLSDYAQKLSVMDLARDKINDLTDRAALRLESLRINAITGAAIAVAGAQDQYWTNLSVTGRNWIGGGGAVSIIDDIIDAHERIARFAHMSTNTLICGTRIGAALQKNIETRDWDRKGPMSLEVAKEGTINGIGIPTTERMDANIGRLAGHEVYISNAKVLTNPNDEFSALTPLLSDDVYILRRGEDLGYLAVFEPISMVSPPHDDRGSSQEWQLRFSVGTVIHRPQGIYTLYNAIAPGA